MRLAVIADIHGNVRALEAVLADIETRHVDLTVNLGDVVSGPLWPRETFELLEALRLPSVRGNHDRALGKGAKAGSWERLALSALSDAARTALASAPPIARLQSDVLACHGTPTSDVDYLLEEISHGTLTLAPPAIVQQRLGHAPTALVLCGHSHQPRIIANGSTLVVNPGSVGCPAYADTRAPSHVSETGSPHARYAIVDQGAGHWAAELIAVAYDWTAAAERARANGSPDWIKPLTTGRTR